MENDVEKILERLNSLEKRLQILEKSTDLTQPAAGSGVPKRLSLKEFIVSKKPANDVQKTLAIGYFLEKFSGVSLFNITDLEAAYERAKEKKPSNMNDKINMNIRNGHMEEATEKKEARKAWYLTNTGESYVESNFNSSEKK